MNKPFISLKVINHYGQTITKIGTRKKIRIYRLLQARKFKDCMFELSVKYTDYYKNEGEYSNLEDLTFALKAFTEKSLVKEFS